MGAAEGKSFFNSIKIFWTAYQPHITVCYTSFRETEWLIKAFLTNYFWQKMCGYIIRKGASYVAKELHINLPLKKVAPGRCEWLEKGVLKMKQFYRMINASRRVLIIRDLNDFFAIIIIDTSFHRLLLLQAANPVENQKNRRIIIIRP